MTGLAQLERQSLCTTLTRVGPHAPTLCEGWDTADLAAHLVVRERRPDAAAGVVIPALAERTARVQDGYAGQTWPTLVEMVRQGPPGWSPTRVPAVDEAVNLVEFFVHHEDVLRASDAPTHRALDDDLRSALWARLKQMGQLMFRRSPVGVVLVTPDHGRRSVHGPTKLGTVVLRGRPEELLLFGYGRSAVAEVEIEGEPEAVAALQGASLGL